MNIFLLNPFFNSGGGGSSFDPLAHANLTGYYDFTDASTVTTATSGKPGVSGENITQIDDQSSSGYHLTPTATNQRPGFLTDGNGITYGRFDNDDLKNVTADIPASTCVIGVYIDGASVNLNRGLVGNRANSAGTKSQYILRFGASLGAWEAGSGTWRPETNRIWEDGANGNTYTQGSLGVYSVDLTGTGGTPVLPNGLLVGDITATGDYYFRGRIYCLALFNAILSDADRQAYEDHIASLMMHTF